MQHAQLFRAQAVFDFDSTLQTVRHSFRVPTTHVLELGTKKLVRLNDNFSGPKNGDTLSTLFDAVGARDINTGKPTRHLWEQEQREGIITNEELLRRQVESVLRVLSVEEAVILTNLMLKPMPGAQWFLQTLCKLGIEIIVVTNGCDRLQSGLMSLYFPGIPFRLFANVLNGNQQRGLDSSHGVDKAKAVAGLRQPLLFCGDSLGDVQGVRATVERGGLVLCLAEELAEWCRRHLQSSQWVKVDDYWRAQPALLRVLAAC